MKVQARAFRPDDLWALADNASERWVRRHIATMEPSTFNPGPRAWTGWMGDRPICCGGLMEIHQYRAVGWMVVVPFPAEVMLRVVRGIRAILDVAPYLRIEAEVNDGFVIGHRWAQLLGFVPEGPSRPVYAADGSASQVYVRLR